MTSPSLLVLALVAGQPCGYSYQAPSYYSPAQYYAPQYYAAPYYPPQFTVKPDYFAEATAAYIRAKAEAEVRARSDQDVVAQLKLIEARLANPPPPGVSTPPQGVSTPPQGVIPAPPPAAPRDSLATILTRNRCVQCHTGDGASGGFKLFEDLNTPVVLDIRDARKIYVRTDPKSLKSMPPKGDRVPDQDRQAIANIIRSDLASAKAAFAEIEESLNNGGEGP